ncbi:hypothetical protein BaRGS_00035869 [Batillaria attramentaria]|uniref:ABC transmembrane type-1 domain-containing protein n=1 Tax=Batillaria attramentaria TaxID=370345 RepID=A0ABD0JDB5_9CAEN
MSTGPKYYAFSTWSSVFAGVAERPNTFTSPPGDVMRQTAWLRQTILKSSAAVNSGCAHVIESYTGLDVTHTSLNNKSLLIDNTWPQFTECFLHTALTWVPCGFLWVMVPYYVISVKDNSSGVPFNFTFLICFKLACCLLLAVTTVVQLVDKAVHNEKWSTAAVLLVTFMTNFERKHGAQGLGMHKHEELYFTATVMSLVLQVTSLCLTFFVNRLPCHSEPNAKVPCPETTCSFPSFLNFWWMTKMVVIGYKRDLTESDLWQLNRSEQSDTLVPVFERAWREESKGPKTTNLLLVLAKMFWWDLLVCFIFKVISDVIFFLSPVFLNLLMQFLSEEKAGRDWQGYVLCLGLFLSCSVKAVFFGHSLFRATRVGIRIKSVLIAAIYKKVLTMNNVTRNRVTAGEIVNMMSVDAQQIMEQMDLVFFGITTPIQVIVAALLLYQVIGWAVLVGVAVLVLQVPINGLIARKEKEYREANLTCKDKRVKLFNEILNAIKVLKLYAWEPSFREKIRHIRKKELSYLFKKVHVNSIMGLIWDMAPYLVTLATFATFILSDREHQLTATDAFVSLAFFNILRAPLNRFATIIVFTIQVYVFHWRAHSCTH